MMYHGYVFPAVVSGQSDALEPSGLMSPCSTVRSLTKELQHSLDLASATSGDKVVTALVSEASVWSPSGDSSYCCALDWMFHFNMTFQENEDEQPPSQSGQQTPGSQRPRSNSGRELTDEVRLLRRLFI